MSATLWQEEQNSGVRWKGFRKVFRWSDGSIRIRSRLSARSVSFFENANGYCLDSSITYDPLPLTSLTSAIEWHDMQVRPCCASHESYENFACVAAPIWPVKSTTGSWQPEHHLVRSRPTRSAMSSTLFR